METLTMHFVRELAEYRNRGGSQEGVISVGPTTFLIVEDPATLVEGQEISIFTDPPADGLHDSQSE